MMVRESEQAVDFLREVLSHDLVVARKIENTAGIREKVGTSSHLRGETSFDDTKRPRFEHTQRCGSPLQRFYTTFFNWSYIYMM